VDATRSLKPNASLPTSNCAYAWRRVYEIYEALQRQPKPEFKPDASQPLYVTLQNTAKRLKEERNFLKNVLYRENYSEADLGLEPGDLTTADVDNDSLFKISARVSKVFDQLRPLTSDQTRIYFLEQRVLKLEAALAAK